MNILLPFKHLIPGFLVMKTKGSELNTLLEVAAKGGGDVLTGIAHMTARFSWLRLGTETRWTLNLASGVGVLRMDWISLLCVSG